MTSVLQVSWEHNSLLPTKEKALLIYTLRTKSFRVEIMRKQARESGATRYRGRQGLGRTDLSYCPWTC